MTTRHAPTPFQAVMARIVITRQIAEGWHLSAIVEELDDLDMRFLRAVHEDVTQGRCDVPHHLDMRSVVTHSDPGELLGAPTSRVRPSGRVDVHLLAHAA